MRRMCQTTESTCVVTVNDELALRVVEAAGKRHRWDDLGVITEDDGRITRFCICREAECDVRVALDAFESIETDDGAKVQAVTALARHWQEAAKAEDSDYEWSCWAPWFAEDLLEVLGIKDGDSE